MTLQTRGNFVESHISYFEGRVIITRGESELTGDFGMTLNVGDKISTGRDSLAILEVEGRGTLKMKSETILKLEGKASYRYAKYFKEDGGSWTLNSSQITVGIGVIFTPDFSLLRKK